MAVVSPPRGGSGEDDAELLAGLIAPTNRRRSSSLIGEIIVELGFARREAVDRAIQASREGTRTTGQILLDSGEIRPDQLARALAERFGVDFVDLSVFQVDPEAVRLLDHELAKRYQAVPVGFLAEDTVLLAIADPTNVLTLDEVAMITGFKMRAAAAAPEDIVALLKNMREPVVTFAQDKPQESQKLILFEGPDADSPVIKIVRELLTSAVELGASDVHLDPTAEGELAVTFRIDGMLVAEAPIAASLAPSVVSRLKIMGEMNIAERRRPQDGRTRFMIGDQVIDARMVTLPLVEGEGLVMRVLDTGAVVRNLRTLGMQDRERDRFCAAIGRPYGAVLVTGPTGSGKSTTLYGALGVINDGTRSVITIEDPVESTIVGVKQIQVSRKAGVTFAAGLRAALRADPDVIMVGEIRDLETAVTSIQGALTGHLMLSTLHTRDAPTALTRLIDMGVEPFMVSAAIDCVVAQRLARKLCDNCRRPADLPDSVLDEYNLRGGELYEPVGCVRCSDTGYHGRLGIYEAMLINEEIRKLVLARAAGDELHEAAIRGGMRTMREDGIDKVRQGLTTLAEVGRVVAAH
jgi:type IV pilus assembly protein PilB